MIKMGLLVASFVFLFVLAFHGAASTTFISTQTLCPNGCSCSLFNTSLFISCEKTLLDSELLSKQLDSLLSSNQTYGHLTQLSIFNSPLTHVPRSICRLTTLTQLHLDNNRLTRLPDNCLTNFTALTSLSASRNNITELQDGLFGGLHTLKTLDLRNNYLSSIGSRVLNIFTSLKTLDLSNNRITQLKDRLFEGLHTLETLDLSVNDIVSTGSRVFNSLSDLKTLDLSYNGITELETGLIDGLHRLETLDLSFNNISSIGRRLFGSSAALNSVRYVDLSSNNIQTLDSWPVYMGINRNVTIDLSYNHIRRFTNMMRWKDNCGMRKVDVSLLLDGNPIRNVSDLLSGWNMSLSTFRCVRPQKHNSVATAICVYLECNCLKIVRFKLQWSLYDGDKLYDNISRVRPLIQNQDNSVPLDQFVCELTERCPSGCRCVHRPANSTLHINCSNANLTVLPLELPRPNSYPKYILDFSNNRLLRRLEHRDYFVNTSILDVSNSDIQITEIAYAWNDILTIPEVNLYGNKLTSFPRRIILLKITTAKLSIAKNPWDCSCDNKWMSGWLKSIAERLTDKVYCYYPLRLRGKSIIQTQEEEFCVDPVATPTGATVSVEPTSAHPVQDETFIVPVIINVLFLVVVGVVVVLLCVICNRLRVKLYTRWKFHPFDRDECPGEDMDYDVFLCCSSLDEEPTGNRILDSIEANGYRVCYHERDFMPGLIVDNIVASVTRSKRTVCLLTNNFIQRSANVFLVLLIMSSSLCLS